MPELEKKLQERFLDNLLNQEKSFENSPISVYQKLVFQRYEEVLKNSFPLFIKEIKPKLFQLSVKEFMKDTPNTPFLWEVPKDYLEFVEKNKFFSKDKYLYELLYFDWVEIELYKREYSLSTQKEFSYKDSYKLSKSARIKRFKYDVINKNYKEKRENFVVIYYDFETNGVIYREINQLIFEILKRIGKKELLKSVLKQLCQENDIDFKEAKMLLRKPLKELYLKRVFK